jgi:hypothetical protein
VVVASRSDLDLLPNECLRDDERIFEPEKEVSLGDSCCGVAVMGANGNCCVLHGFSVSLPLLRTAAARPCVIAVMASRSDPDLLPKKCLSDDDCTLEPVKEASLGNSCCGVADMGASGNCCVSHGFSVSLTLLRAAAARPCVVAALALRGDPDMPPNECLRDDDCTLEPVKEASLGDSCCIMDEIEELRCLWLFNEDLESRRGALDEAEELRFRGWFNEDRETRRPTLV